MNITEGMKIISEGWIAKPKGFRVKYEKLVGTECITEYSPGLDENPMDSDVTTLRYAWKLSMATRSDSSENAPEELFNVTVVDDADNPIIHYATGKIEVLNQKSHST